MASERSRDRSGESVAAGDAEDGAEDVARSAALPLYLRISERLTRDILAGAWPAGARLPPERALAIEQGAAVGTVRKALAELERRGLLIRRQGSGTYVRPPSPDEPPPPSVYALFRLELLRGGGLPTAQVLSVVRSPKPPDAPPFGAADTARRIRRLRLLDGQPAALEEIWLDGDHADVIDAKSAQGALPEALYRYYADALGLEICAVEDRVSVAPAPDWGPSAFGPASGAACGYVERIARAKGGAPVEFSRTWVDPSVAVYAARTREQRRWRG